MVSALFSRIVSGVRVKRVAVSNRKVAKAKMPAVIVTPIDQPVLKNTYKFDKHITMPIKAPTKAARSVN